MRRSSKVSYEWTGARAKLDRLAKANARADETWLRSLSVEESALILEDLCRGIPELDVTSELEPPPVVLWRLWRR
jgi:hypothetical protein